MTTNNPQSIADSLEKQATKLFDIFYENLDELVRNSLDYSELEDDDDVEEEVDAVIDILYSALGIKYVGKETE